MADAQIGNTHEVAACSVGTGSGNRSNLHGGNVDASTAYSNVNFNNIASLKARLLAIRPTTTQQQMNTMTMNDLQYAVRLYDDPLSIKQ